MRGLPITLDPELEPEVVEDIGESAAKDGSFLVIPREHLRIVDVWEEQRPPWLREGGRSAIENEKRFGVCMRDSEESEGQNHAPNEHAMDNVECPVPSHGHCTEAGKHRCVRAYIDEVHAGVIRLRDTDFAGGKDAFEPKPSAEAQPTELVERVNPIKGNEAPAERSVGMTCLSSFKQRAAEANRR